MEYIKLFESFDKEKSIIKELILNNDFDKVREIMNSSERNLDRHSPPEDFEREYDVIGISKKYKLPFGLDEKLCENLTTETFMEDEEITTLFFRELLKLNPELMIFKNLKYKDDTGYLMSSVLGGCCSRMIIEDIKEYIYIDTEIYEFNNESGYLFKRSGKIDYEYSDLMNILWRNNISITYFPSTNTLMKIINQLKLKI